MRSGHRRRSESRGPPHLSRPAAPHGARRARRTASLSSTTARRPTRPRPRRRWPRSDAIRWILGGQAKTRQSRRMRAAFRPCRARPIPSARRANCSRGCWRRTCRWQNAETLEEAVKQRRGGCRSRAIRCCCRRPALVRPVPGLRGARRPFRELVGAL